MGNYPVMPDQASQYAVNYDWLFWVTSALTVIFTLLVYALVLVLVIRYRKGKKVNRSNPAHHNTLLEVTWSVIPGILGLGIFYWAAHLYVGLKTPPKDATEIFVIGKQWMWHIQHMNGVRENNELHVPVGKPVRLTMISQDVIHSFYMPAFRMKMDVVPGRFTSEWFLPSKPGRYHLFCAEYCGTQHSKMIGWITVMNPGDFAKWQQNGGNKFEPVPVSLEQAGKKIYDRYACGNCHGSADNERAPTLYGIYGSKRRLTDGTTMVADNDYLRESIIDPYKHLTAGYDKTMSDYKDVLNEEEIIQLIAYMRSLGSASTTTISNSATPNAVRADATTDKKK